MGCITPITVGPDERKSTVRCGKCRYCRIRKKSSWLGRIMLELKSHEHARFITLTYAEDPGKLDYRDFQLFLKRYRKRTNDKFRYFAVGEYGEKGGRGHWHAIIFGHRASGIGHWLNNHSWQLGYSFDGTVTTASAGYVAGYTLKDTIKGYPAIVRRSLKPGIGLPAIRKLGAYYAEKIRGARIERWPASFDVSGRRYALCDGSLTAFKEAFIKAGGLPPPELTDEDRHAVALERLGAFGELNLAEYRLEQQIKKQPRRIQL